MAEEGKPGVGGTPGGIWEFFGGIVMAGVGTYMFLQKVHVTSGGWFAWHGVNAFGLSLVPMLIGVAILFYNGKSVLGWLLTATGFGIILAGVLMNLVIYFQDTSLYDVLLILVLLAGGLGLIARSLKPHPGPAA